VYLVIEPEELVSNWLALRYLNGYVVKDVADLDAFPGLKLKQVESRTAREPRDSHALVVDVGTRSGRRYLRDGWAGDERDRAQTYAWVVGRRATLSVALTPGRAHRITLSAASIPTKGARQRVSIRVNGVEVAVLPLSRDTELLRATVPGRLVKHENLVELDFALAVAPSSLDPASPDQRELAASVDFISFKAFEEESSAWFDRHFVNFDEASKDALGNGWSGIEIEPNGDTLCWCAATTCTLRLRGRPFGATRVSARLAPLTGISGPPQSVRLFLNGVPLGERVLPGQMAVSSFEAARDAWRGDENELRFDFARADRPRSGDRTLAARFDWVEVASR
jgi:hypothetical protein